ncbi:MAG TPA: PEP-CTERM sorting domain-containing protein [Casimicrobiaceae bacterium]|nr:PEP-CTERM sorting domain-containing protein [Casimicrobiaceae bacterium]
MGGNMRLQHWLLAVMFSTMPFIAVAGPGASDNIGRLPEPETLALLVAGVIALVIAKRRRK